MLLNACQEKHSSPENIPVTTYRLTPITRNKTLSYKEIIIASDEISFSFSAGTCDCKRSRFCDENHCHTITGDLRLITNTELRSLLSKGPNYREPNTINYKKCKIAIQN